MAADVVMLNLWAHDVGRADGQAYSVLRSVFEEAVRLYEGQDDGVPRGGDGGGGVGGAARFPKASLQTSSGDVIVSLAFRRPRLAGRLP